MEDCLDEFGFDEWDIDVIIKLISTHIFGHENVTVVKINDYYFVVNNNDYICCFKADNISSSFIMLHEAHRIIIKNNALDLFSEQIFEELSDKTEVNISWDKNEFCLWDANNSFTIASRKEGLEYYCDFSELSDDKQQLLKIIYSLYTTPNAFRLMWLIAETYDFTTEYPIKEFSQYTMQSSDNIVSLYFGKNCKTDYKIVKGRLQMIEKKNIVITSAELIKAHLFQLRQIIYTYQDQFDITLPKQFNNRTSYEYIYRICKSRGYGFKQENGQYVIMTYTGKSDSVIETEFIGFHTAEKVSQRLIDFTIKYINEHTQNPIFENTVILYNMRRELNSCIFMEWFKDFCCKNGFTYTIKNNSITITLFP